MSHASLYRFPVIIAYPTYYVNVESYDLGVTHIKSWLAVLICQSPSH
jgi:hypothetical protein